MSCGLRRSKEITVSAAGSQNIFIPDNHWLHEIIIVQGATPLAATATLEFATPGRANQTIMTLAAGTADNNDAYNLRHTARGATGTAISGTAIPVNLGIGGITVTAGGTVSGSAKITVVTADFPPAS